MKGFQGQVFLADIFSVDAGLLASEDVIKLLLLRCVEAIGMTPVLTSYQSVKFPLPIGGVFRGDFGISAGMLLVESHIYIHTWPEKGYARFEVSSCRRFSDVVDRLVEVIRTILGGSIVYEIVDWRGGNGFKEGGDLQV
ncbi:MAG: S-adenosylmethionine decarboxylase [Archaeoglobaceae archaeon]